MAQEICRRYHNEFTDENERYGPAGRAWCLHDNQTCLPGRSKTRATEPST